MREGHDGGDNVVYERRSFLGLAAAAIAEAARGGRTSRSPTIGEDLRLTVAEFAKIFVPMARELLRDTSRMGEDRYLHTLASLAVRLVDVPVPELRQNSKGDLPKTFIGANEIGDDAPFVVLHWKMEPSAKVGLHPHTYGNVVTLGLEGEAVIENYEMVGEPDFDRKEPFDVRKVHEQILRPFDTNLVPLSHGYVHGFTAGPSGARGLDITTRIREKRPNATLKVSPKSGNAGFGIFEGRWVF